MTRAQSILAATAVVLYALASARGQDAVPYPPRLPGGQAVVTDTSPEFLSPGDARLREGVEIATTPPTIDFLYYPGQDYPGQPWSNWGDSLAAGGKYYASIGDHLAIGAKGDGTHGTGTAFVYEYDPATKRVRQLVDVAKLLALPAGHYTPGKIHSRLDMGKDGWLYYATHRGSERATSDRYRYRGDWILRTHPRTGKSEVVAHGPVPKHSIPASVFDPERLIFYGATAPGAESDLPGIRFFAYDTRARKVLYQGGDGPARALAFAPSTGRVYWVPGQETGELLRYDPASGGAPVKVAGSRIGIRAATEETPQGRLYTVSQGQGGREAEIFELDTKTEKTRSLGAAAVGSQTYVASIDADPTGRYLYYVPGAHGGSERDGAAVVRFDVRTGRKQVVAFLHPFYQRKYGCTLKGTYSTAVDPSGERLYVTWNASRNSRVWDSCALTVIHLPASER